MNKETRNTPYEKKETNIHLARFVVKLKETLASKYIQDNKLCTDINQLYIQGATQSEIAETLLSAECIKSAGITKQVISRILQDTMDIDIRREISRQKGNANLKHDREKQRERGKKGGEKKILNSNTAQKMGEDSHTNRISTNISKEIYELRTQRGKETFIETETENNTPLIGSRNTILRIISHYLEYTYNIKKTPDAIRGIIEREGHRRRLGKTIFEEISPENKNILIKKYLELEKSGEKIFKEKDREYSVNSEGMVEYIKDTLGLTRTKQRFYILLREYKKTLSAKK